MTDSVTTSMTSAALVNNANAPARPRGANWFEAFASAWGDALDGQAARIEAQSNRISVDGVDQPSEITKLTAESMRFGFMSNSSHTSLDSVSKALETMARKG
ncbi:hypothetical protein ACMGDM_19025 [Sphingomonas sp. DT-51]|uniref:hypothetical protein n=1 Tax=Sphingomonas sp. DT-51 TaxID=3396165 RepID=UPI003F1E1E3C